MVTAWCHSTRAYPTPALARGHAWACRILRWTQGTVLSEPWVSPQKAWGVMLLHHQNARQDEYPAHSELHWARFTWTVACRAPVTLHCCHADGPRASVSTSHQGSHHHLLCKPVPRHSHPAPPGTLRGRPIICASGVLSTLP